MAATEIDLTEVERSMQVSLESVVQSIPEQPSIIAATDDRNGQENACFNAAKFHNGECTWPSDKEGEPQAPVGWPRIVHLHEDYRNMDLIRTFVPELRRLMLYFGSEAALISKKLRAYDEVNQHHLRCLPSSAPVHHESPKPDGQYGELILRLDEKLSKYFSVVSSYLAMRKLFPAPVERHWTLVQAIENEELLESGAAVYYEDPESFSTCEPLPPSWITRVVHSSAARRLMGQFSRTGPFKNSMTVSNPEAYIINLTHIFGTGFFLLSPIAAMMLADLTNLQVFGLIAGCTLAFSFFISKTYTYETGRAFIAVCGYLAVMAAFAVATSKE